MQDREKQALIDARLRILNVICAAMAGSVLLYGVIAWFLFARAGFSSSGAVYDMPFVLYLLAASAVGALLLAPMVSGMVLRQGLARSDRSKPDQVFNTLQSSVIVGFAIRESAAVIGLVMTLLTGSMTWMAALGAAAIGAMITAWPRRERLAALLENRPMPIG